MPKAQTNVYQSPHAGRLWLDQDVSGISAHQPHRSLGITYKSAWFLALRIRETKDGATGNGPLGGGSNVVEANETYVGGTPVFAITVALRTRKPFSHWLNVKAMFAAFALPISTQKKVRALIVTNVDRTAHLMTDDSPIYTGVGREFSVHDAVDHGAKEYVSLEHLRNDRS